MTQIGFSDRWHVTIGNVTIIGRPLLSKFGPTRGYDKGAVKTQLTLAVTIAGQMLDQMRDLATLYHAKAMQVGRLGQTNLNREVLTQAQTHFKMPPLMRANYQEWTALFHELGQMYMMIGQGIRGTLALVDVETGARTCGHVNRQNSRFLDPHDDEGLIIADRGRIHINFVWSLTRTPQRVARTIIHEGAHKFIGARDHAYKWEANYPTLTKEQARTNADSIACFAYYLWKSGVYAIH